MFIKKLVRAVISVFESVSKSVTTILRHSYTLKGIKLSLLFLLMLSACKKDRVEQDDFLPMDDFHNKYRQQEQEFVIDTGSNGTCLLVGKQGTLLYNICDTASFRRQKDSSGITYPYKIKLVEIYSVADRILYPLPATSGGQPLEAPASIRVRGFKDADELVLKQSKAYNASLDTMTNLDAAMQVFDGSDSNMSVDWTPDAISTVSLAPDFYTLNVARMGWVSCAKVHPSANNAVLTVTVTGTNTQNIGIYVVLKNSKSVLKIDNLISGPIPVGEPITFIAFALNQKNEFLLDQRDMVLTGNTTLPLNFTAVSEADLMTALGAL